MKSLIVISVLMAFASATEFAEDSEEARLFLVNNNNNLYLGLNSTYLWWVAGVAVLGAAAVILYFGLAEGRFKAAYSRYGEEFFGQQDEHYYNQYDYQTRHKRFSDNDVASKMAQLEQAFKKYQVEEAECELYIACEASQVHRIEENGPLARVVYDILSTFNRAKDSHKWDDRMDSLVQAFEYGTGAHQAGQVDPCQPLRNKCFELHAKKSY